MKKTMIIVFIAICFGLLVSCEPHIHNFGDVVPQCTTDVKAECIDCGEITVIKATGHIDSDGDGICDVCGEEASTVIIHVTSLDELKTAPAQAASLGTKMVILDNDIAWPSSQTEVIEIDMTGLNFNMNGHSITDIKTNALNFIGDSFTIRNGSFTSSSDNTKYSFCINYNGSNATTSALISLAQSKIPEAFTDSDNVWKHRIILDGITANSCLAGYSTLEVKNCSFSNGVYRGLVFQGSSGIVQDTSIVTANTATSAGLVAHSYGEITLKGIVTVKGKFGGYASISGKITVAADATVSFNGFSNYGLYIEKGGIAVLSSGTTLGTPADYQVHFGTDGGTVTLNGAIIKDKNGATVVSVSYDGTGTIN